MNNKKIIALFIIVIAVVAMTLTSCDTVNDIVGKLPIFGEDHQHVFSDATCIAPKTCACGVTEGEALGHDYDAFVTDPTCTEDGYTTYTCACGDSYTDDEVEASGHDYDAFVTDPTCTEDGYTTYTCACGDSYTDDEVEASGHDYDAVVTKAPTCTATGIATYTCTCGDSYTEELSIAEHIDKNLDITCDFDGCTNRILPAADSKVSLFTANHMIIVSLSGNYYVEGTVTEVIDAKNGNFIITDAEGYTFFIRMPVDANGVTHANWQSKVAVGDVVSVYGKPKSTSGWNTTEKAGMQSGVLTFIERHPHDFTFSPAGCSDPAYCACGEPYGEPLGCADTDGDDLCDDCGKNVKYTFEYVEIRTDNGSGVHDETALTYTWTNGNFDVQVAKATGGNLYVSSNNYMRLYKGNTLTLTSNNGIAVKVVVVHLTNATHVTNFEKFLTGYKYTVDAEKFTISIEVDAAETIVFTNPSNGSTTYVKGIEFGYEK